MNNKADDHLQSSAETISSGRRLVLGAAVLLAAVVTAGALLIEGTGAVDVSVTVALVIAAGVAAHREAVFPDETALSASVVVICACVVGTGEASLVPPILCGAAAALHREHLRDRHYLKIGVNLSATVVPALMATLTYRALEGSAGQIAGACSAVVAYWVLNNAIVGTAMGFAHAKGLRSVWALIRSETVMLVFGLGGALCGLVMVEVGAWVGIATLVALLVALDVFVISAPGGLVDLRTAWLMLATRGVSGGMAGTVSALVTRAVSISVLGAFTGLVAGFVAGVAVMAVVVGVRFVVKYGRADLPTISGLLAIESIVPLVAALSGVAVAVAGFEVGLLIASALVIVVSILVAVLRHRTAKAPAVADDDALMAAVVEAMMDGLPVREH